MEFLYIAGTIVYLMLGFVAYANDYFDDIAPTNDPIVNVFAFVLSGTAIISIRVINTIFTVVKAEVEKAAIGAILTSLFDLVLRAVKYVWSLIVRFFQWVVDSFKRFAKWAEGY